MYIYNIDIYIYYMCIYIYNIDIIYIHTQYISHKSSINPDSMASVLGFPSIPSRCLRCQGQLCRRGEPLVITRLGIVSLGRGFKNGGRTGFPTGRWIGKKLLLDVIIKKYSRIYICISHVHTHTHIHIYNI